MIKQKLLLLIVSGILISTTGCATLWKPVFILGKSVKHKHYQKPIYYNGPHYLCRYEGPHIHHEKDVAGPVSVSETKKEDIVKKYRYPGMEDVFKDLDSVAW